MIGNPVKVNILQCRTRSQIRKENIHVFYTFRDDNKIEFTFKFHGDPIVYQSSTVVDISNGIPESNYSLIFRPTESIKTTADATCLGLVKFTFTISKQQRQGTTSRPPRSSPTEKTTTTKRPSPRTRRNTHSSPKPPSSDLLFLGLLLVGVTVAGLGIGMSSV